MLSFSAAEIELRVLRQLAVITGEVVKVANKTIEDFEKIIAQANEGIKRLKNGNLPDVFRHGDRFKDGDGKEFAVLDINTDRGGRVTLFMCHNYAWSGTYINFGSLENLRDAMINKKRGFFTDTWTYVGNRPINL